MAELYTIKNDKLTVAVSSRGAEIISVTGAGGTEFMWEGNPDVWGFHAPILFPICGGLKDGKFTYDGKEYELAKHGYIRWADFEAETIQEDKLVFVHKSSAETLKSYPFEYEFRAIFTLCGNKLDICYNVKNKSGKNMYFSVGAHEGYACPEGIREYKVVFDKPEKNLCRNDVGTNVLLDKTHPVELENNALWLKDEEFETDAYVFKKIVSRKVVLEHSKSTKKVTLEFPGHDYFLIWTIPGAKYICLEPWCGLPDGEHSTGRIEEKEGIICVADNDEYDTRHIITFEE